MPADGLARGGLSAVSGACHTQNSIRVGLDLAERRLEQTASLAPCGRLPQPARSYSSGRYALLVCSAADDPLPCVTSRTYGNLRAIIRASSPEIRTGRVLHKRDQ